MRKSPCVSFDPLSPGLVVPFHPLVHAAVAGGPRPLIVPAAEAFLKLANADEMTAPVYQQVSVC